MNRVLDRLWVGDSRDLDGSVPLRALGFSAVVDLRDGAASYRGVESFQLANRDGDPWDAAEVESALAYVAEKIRHGKVLVACAAGKSRSASMVVGYLVRCGWSAAEAYEHLRSARPEVAPVEKMLSAVLPITTEPPR